MCVDCLSYHDLFISSEKQWLICVTFMLKSQFFRRLLAELSLFLAINMLITIYFVILDWHRDYVLSDNLMADFIIPMVVTKSNTQNVVRDEK